MLVDTDDLVSNIDIARLAGVSKSAIPNWVARYPDFPKPVASFSNGKFKLYLWTQVKEWLETPHAISYTRPAKVVTRVLPARFPREEE